MKQVVPFFLLLIVVLMGVWYINTKGVPKIGSLSLVNTPTISVANTVSIGDKVTVTVEVADTDEKRTLGLSGHKPLGENEGMLFIFDSPQTPTFWMKEMLFDLDMIWIDENNTIVDIHENVPTPEPSTLLGDLPLYAPKSPITRILEVNAGFAEKNSIVIGDTVKFESGN